MTTETSDQQQPAPQPQPSEETATRAGSRVDWAAVPKVNLLPPEILEGRRFARLQRWLAVVVVAVVALAAAGTWWAQTQVAEAEDRLAAAQVETAALQRKEASYAKVPKILAQVRAAESARQEAMANDLLWSKFLNQIALATTSDVWLTKVDAQVTAGTDGAGATAVVSSTEPLQPAGIGTLTVEGAAHDYDDVAGWLEAFQAIPGLDVSTLHTAVSEPGDDSAAPVTFTTSVTITAAALTHRFDTPKAG